MQLQENIYLNNVTFFFVKILVIYIFHAAEQHFIWILFLPPLREYILLLSYRLFQFIWFLSIRIIISLKGLQFHSFLWISRVKILQKLEIFSSCFCSKSPKILKSTWIVCLIFEVRCQLTFSWPVVY